MKHVPFQSIYREDFEVVEEREGKFARYPHNAQAASRRQSHHRARRPANPPAGRLRYEVHGKDYARRRRWAH